METATVDERLVARLTQAPGGRDEILEAYLFGSFARGQTRLDSDVDIAVFVGESADDEGHWGDRAELTTDLMAALGTDDVDVAGTQPDTSSALPSRAARRVRLLFDDFEQFASHVEDWLAGQDDA